MSGIRFRVLTALLSLRSKEAADEAIYRATARAEIRNRGPLRADQKRRFDMLKRWNDARP